MHTVTANMEDIELSEEFEKAREGHTILMLNYKGLHHIPDCLLEGEAYSHIQKLYLKRNLLKQVPDTIKNLSSLVEIYLHSNEITALPEEIGGLTNLEYLNLNSNFLTAIPESVGNLKRLRKLDLSNNAITRLPKSMGMLKNLVTLEAMNNKLSYLPLELFDCHQLVTVNLDINKLRIIPRQICRLRSLLELSICDNDLILVPQNIGQTESLTFLYLDKNSSLFSVPCSTVTLQVGANRCGTDPASLALIDRLCCITFSHTETETLTLPLPQEIMSIGTPYNTIPTLLEFCLRVTHVSVKDKDSEECSAALADLPSHLRSLLTDPTASCQYCQREVFVMAFPVVFHDNIQSKLYLLGLCCSMRCLRLCLSSVNFPVVYPKLEDMSLAVVLA